MKMIDIMKLVRAVSVLIIILGAYLITYQFEMIEGLFPLVVGALFISLVCFVRSDEVIHDEQYKEWLRCQKN